MTILKLFAASLLLLPLLLKACYVDSFIDHYTGTRFLGFLQVLAHDGLIYSGLLLLIYVSFLEKIHRLIAGILRLTALALLTVYSIDYIIIVNFNTHLTLGDALKYTDYAFKYIQQIYHLNTATLSAISLLLASPIVFFLFNKFKPIDNHYKRLCLTLIFSLPLISGFTDNNQYIHGWIYKNVIDYNLTILSESAPYSQAFMQSINAGDALNCQTSPIEKKNIIILMVESLSSYQSQYFSGIHDWTPQLDAIAAQHQAFKNFYANGFITEDGEIALLTGLPPIYPPSSYSDDGGVSFNSFYAIQNSLPHILKAHGYRTEFLTSADLEFGNTGPWAQSIGFDYVEGHEHPYYQSWPRFHFQAAPDEALFNRAMDRIKQLKARRFLMFIKTVSTHHPYINPENNHASEAEAFQYADQQIGRFYQSLLAKNFFANGLLIIVGDHHSMTPLKKAEGLVFGQRQASAKVPLVIIGAEPQATVEWRQFQQTDVFNSLQGMVSGQQCHSPWQGILWGEHQTPAQYILHRRGDNRDIISVFAEHDDYQVKLDGDQTRVIGQQVVTTDLQRILLEKINTLRINRIKHGS